MILTMTANGVEQAHDAILRRDDLLARRRALYSAALAFLNGNAVVTRDPEVEVLDNPLVRGEVAHGLAGAKSPVALRPVGELAPEVRRGGIRLVSVRTAALAPVLARIGSQVREHGDQTEPVVLTAEDPAYVRAAEVVDEGEALLESVVPEMARDLLAHVGLVAVLEARGRLGSASLRDYPGLVLLPMPTCALEAAEALVHEGAHQKFFDLAIVTDVLAPGVPEHPVRPSWLPVTAPDWSFAQCAAAFHTYCLLAVLERAVRGRYEMHQGSLLPHAAQRATELGSILRGGHALLGAEGRQLLGQFTGTTSAADLSEPPLTTTPWRRDPGAVLRTVGDWTVAVYGNGPSIVRFTPSVRAD